MKSILVFSIILFLIITPCFAQKAKEYNYYHGSLTKAENDNYLFSQLDNDTLLKPRLVVFKDIDTTGLYKSVICAPVYGKNHKGFQQSKQITVRAKKVNEKVIVEGSSYEKIEITSISLDDGYVFFAEVTIPFPDILEKEQDYKFIGGSSGAFAYELYLKRVNDVSIVYNYLVYKDDNIIFRNKGIAHLNRYFYMGSESYTDDKTGIDYFAYPYTTDNQDCYFSFSVEEFNDDGQLRAVVVKTDCKGKELIGSYSNITLREKKE